MTDANGNTVTHTYDGFGRLTSSTVPGGRTHYKGYRWCDSSCPTNAQYYEFRKQAGSPTVKHYKDSFNRTLLTQAQGFGGAPIYTRIDYDGLGRKTFESIPSFDANPSVGTRYSSYDTLGRLTYKATDQANAGVMTTRYSYHGHTTDITATDGSILTMSRTYGTDGKLIQTVDAAQGKTGYAYDSRGNPITLTDANDHSIHAWYNGFGHKWQVDDPNMGVKSFAYNTFGEVESETDANGDTVTHRYDSVGRLTERRVNGVAQAEFIYDTAANGLGLLAGELGQGIAKSYTYDGYSRTKTTTTSIDNTPYTAEVFYDGGNGRVKAYRYPGSALTVGYGYDAYGYQTQVFNAESGFVYQAVSRRDARLNVLQAFKNYSDDTDADKLREERTYAPASGQLTMIDLKTEWGAEQQHNLSYVYGDFGNLDSQAQWHPGGITTETYVYDRLHRLTHSQSTPYGPIDYEYDAVGNLIKKSDYASVIHYGAVGNSNTANAGPNAITGITRNGTVIDDFLYDNNGNLRDGNGKSLSYNAFNKPISISKGGITSTFAYGADLSRYKHLKTKAGQTDETTLYIGKQVEIVQSGDSTTTKTYIDDIAIVEKEETVNQSLADHRIRFTHRDRLGSVITLTDHHNQITEQRSYDAFGKPRNADMSDGLSATLLGTNDNVSVFTPRGFTDHEHLDDAELIHMNGRVYDYNLGRFLSVDPFIQAPGNSQSMNPYSYIMNNPLAGTDPSGYASSCISPSSLACQYDGVDEGNTDPFATSCVLTCVDASGGNGKNKEQSSTAKSSEPNIEQLEGPGQRDSTNRERNSIGDGDTSLCEPDCIAGYDYSDRRSTPVKNEEHYENGRKKVTRYTAERLYEDPGEVSASSIAGKVNDNFITPLGIAASALEMKYEKTKQRWSSRFSKHAKYWDRVRLVGNYAFVAGSLITAGTTINDLIDMRKSGASGEAMTLRGVDGLADIGAGALAFVAPPFGLIAAAAYFAADYFSPNQNLTENIYRRITGRREDDED